MGNGQRAMGNGQWAMIIFVSQDKLHLHLSVFPRGLWSGVRCLSWPFQLNPKIIQLMAIL